MNLARQIIDTVLKCHSSIRSGRIDRTTAYDVFYSEIGFLFLSNEEQFIAYSFSMLQPDDFAECPEESVIRLECAGIYHKNGLDAYLFRMRYYLNIASSQDDDLLEKKISSAFSLKRKSALESFDARSPYEKLIFDVIGKKDVYSEALWAAINRFVAEK